jgi:hypothetical protein
VDSGMASLHRCEQSLHFVSITNEARTDPSCTNTAFFRHLFRDDRLVRSSGFRCAGRIGGLDVLFAAATEQGNQQRQENGLFGGARSHFGDSRKLKD